MSQVNGTVGLVAVDASTLSGTIAGYLVSFTEAGGATPPAPIAVVLDQTSFTVTLAAGVWTASAVGVDSTGAPVSAPVTGTITITSVTPVPVTVNIPSSVTLTVAP